MSKFVTVEELAKELVKAEQDEYELIGTIDGTYAGRWMIAAFAENAAVVWPDGTAVYVRRGEDRFEIKEDRIHKDPPGRRVAKAARARGEE